MKRTRASDPRVAPTIVPAGTDFFSAPGLRRNESRASHPYWFVTMRVCLLAGRSPELKNKTRLRLDSVWVATNLKILPLSRVYVDVTGESPIPSAKI